jgi:hypothetical protein
LRWKRPPATKTAAPQAGRSSVISDRMLAGPPLTPCPRPAAAIAPGPAGRHPAGGNSRTDCHNWVTGEQAGSHPPTQPLRSSHLAPLGDP